MKVHQLCIAVAAVLSLDAAPALPQAPRAVDERVERIALAITPIQRFALGAPPAQSAGPVPVALVREWRLNPARTHYGPGVNRRRSERFSCSAEANQVRCVIRSVRADGQTLTGRFRAPVDGTSAPVTGIPDIDEVQLRHPSRGLIDATFLSRGKPAFGYRAFQSQDGRSLMMVTVDPVSRVTLSTVVVYDRR